MPSHDAIHDRNTAISSSLEITDQVVKVAISSMGLMYFMKIQSHKQE
jgi:hypothetical protein